MKRITKLLVGTTFLLVACGKPTVIDEMKKAHLAECPDHGIGRIVIGYFQKTSWTAYATDVDAVKRITASGGILYVGREVDAELEFLFNEETGNATLESVSFDGERQLKPFADALVSNMCDKAG